MVKMPPGSSDDRSGASGWPASEVSSPSSVRVLLCSVATPASLSPQRRVSSATACAPDKLALYASNCCLSGCSRSAVSASQASSASATGMNGRRLSLIVRSRSRSAAVLAPPRCSLSLTQRKWATHCVSCCCVTVVLAASRHTPSTLCASSTTTSAPSSGSPIASLINGSSRYWYGHSSSSAFSASSRAA